jgi:hypothetical protein
MNRRVPLGIAGWLTVAVAATGVGIAALGVLEDGITGSRVRPLDQDAVRRELSGTGAPPVSPSETASPGVKVPGGDEVTRVLRTDGGTVTAACAAGRARLVAWYPAQGFGADDLERGPAAVVSLKFKSDDAEYEVTVECAADGPAVRTRKDDGHGRHGRGHG